LSGPTLGDRAFSIAFPCTTAASFTKSSWSKPLDDFCCSCCWTSLRVGSEGFKGRLKKFFFELVSPENKTIHTIRKPIQTKATITRRRSGKRKTRRRQIDVDDLFLGELEEETFKARKEEERNKFFLHFFHRAHRYKKIYGSLPV